MDFTHFVQLIAIGLQARIPMHMTGFPGVGKTEFTKSLEDGIHARRHQVQGRHPDRVDTRAAGLRRLPRIDARRRASPADGVGA